MVYSNTTDKSGLLQACEFWTNLGDGGISGDTFLKQQFTVRLNSAFERILPTLMSRSKAITFDDPNNADLPLGRYDITSGVNNYTISEDDNALDILNVVSVSFLPNATATEYLPLTQMTADDARALRAMSPNPSDVGVPTHYIEKGNLMFLFPQPNYTAVNGVKISFEREPSRFATTDTTKEPGIPKPFHELLALYASYDWILVNKSEQTTLITRLEAQILRRENQLGILNDKRNPVRHRLMGYTNNRSI